MSSRPSANIYESIFHSSTINLVIPEASTYDPSPADDDLPVWWSSIQKGTIRNSAYFDEKLAYFMAISLPDETLVGLSDGSEVDVREPTSELLKFVDHLQLTMAASFVPYLPASDSCKSQSESKGVGTPSALSASTTLETLAPPSSAHLHQPTPRSIASSGNAGHNPEFPPATPNPFPVMPLNEEQYASAEGVVIWEGGVEEQPWPWEEGRKRREAHAWQRRVFRWEGRWEIVWRGEVPIAYVRTPVENPILALTASITFRQHNNHKTHRKGQSMDTISIRSGTETVHTDGIGNRGSGKDEDWAAMEEIDLLDGLAGEGEFMPTTRLPSSLRQDLFIPSGPPPSPMPLSAMTPASAPFIATPSTASTGLHRERGHLPTFTIPTLSTTLRKSFRRVFTLAPGLRVRMRTILIPQLLPLSPSPDGDSEEGERRIVLLIEIENNSEPTHLQGFEITRVNIEVGGKGSFITTKLSCQPEGPSESNIFPIRLDSTEQYNLLYSVEITGEKKDNAVEEAVARGLGRGEETRPVAITVVGRPYRYLPSAHDTLGVDTTDSADTFSRGRTYTYPTGIFHSRWNCTLDLTPFYASQPPSQMIPPPHKRSSLSLSKSHRRPPALSMPVWSTNTIVGDKRYSLASLISQQERYKDREGLGAGQRRAMLPSQVMQASRGLPSRRATSVDESTGYGLLLSIKVLPQLQPHSAQDPLSTKLSLPQNHQTIKPLMPFSIEVFVYNRTNEVRRFRLNIPGREKNGRWDTRARDVFEKSRRGGGTDSTLNDADLKIALASHLAASPALIPLEDDIRCGPLLPGASLSARIRFVALREGVHTIEKLRVLGVDDGIDWTMSPVIDIIVGKGVDTL
ncbi:hypothetical protein L204_101377 [Cryptococcus depauperatus]|nr:hypothetical protein L204_04047 [Cryptococcus depauperatus CBS 7855]